MSHVLLSPLSQSLKGPAKSSCKVGIQAFTQNLVCKEAMQGVEVQYTKRTNAVWLFDLVQRHLYVHFEAIIFPSVTLIMHVDLSWILSFQFTIGLKASSSGKQRTCKDCRPNVSKSVDIFSLYWCGMRSSTLQNVCEQSPMESSQWWTSSWHVRSETRYTWFIRFHPTSSDFMHHPGTVPLHGAALNCSHGSFACLAWDLARDLAQRICITNTQRTCPKSAQSTSRYFNKSPRQVTYLHPHAHWALLASPPYISMWTIALTSIDCDSGVWRKCKETSCLTSFKANRNQYTSDIVIYAKMMQNDECPTGSWPIKFQISCYDCAQAKVVNLNAITATAPIEKKSLPQSSIVSLASSEASSQISQELMRQFLLKNLSVWTASKRNTRPSYDPSHQMIWLQRASPNAKLRTDADPSEAITCGCESLGNWKLHASQCSSPHPCIPVRYNRASIRMVIWLAKVLPM